MSEVLNHKITYQMVLNLTIGLFLIITALIVINISIAQNAYAVEELTQQVQELNTTVHQKEIENEKLASPELLSQKAEALGMVTVDVYNFHMLNIVD